MRCISREFVDPYSELENEYKVIFVHVPKNAGNGFAQSVFGMNPKGHNYCWHYKKYDQGKYNQYFKFSLTRNVHSRFYSAYRYLMTGGFGVYDREFRSRYLKDLSFEDFVMKMSYEESYRKSVMSWTHFIPQVDFLLVEGRCELDYVGSVEKIDDAMKDVSERLGIEFSENKVVNSSGTEQLEEYYTPVLYDLVEEFYKKDVHFINNMKS